MRRHAIRKPSRGNSCLQRLAHRTFIWVSFRAIEVPKSSFQRVSGSTYRLACIGNQGAKPEYRHMAGFVVERHSLTPKIRRFDHDDSSALSRSRIDHCGRQIKIFGEELAGAGRRS